MKDRTFNIVGGLFLILVITIQCSDANAGEPNRAETAAVLAQWCEVHNLQRCPRLSWTRDPVNRRLEGGVKCGFTGSGKRACDIALWSRTDDKVAALRHEFAHVLTFLDGSDPELHHGEAFKRALAQTSTD